MVDDEGEDEHEDGKDESSSEESDEDAAQRAGLRAWLQERNYRLALARQAAQLAQSTEGQLGE